MSLSLTYLNSFIPVVVLCSGHCAIPGHLPPRSHHAGHSSQRQTWGKLYCLSYFTPCSESQYSEIENSDTIVTIHFVSYRMVILTLTKGDGWVSVLYFKIANDISTIKLDYILWIQEFEVIAQIRLLQSSCKNSIFRTDETFVYWYHSVPTLHEEERSVTLTWLYTKCLRCALFAIWIIAFVVSNSYKLSNQIEAPSEPSPGRGLNPTVVITQCPE